MDLVIKWSQMPRENNMILIFKTESAQSSSNKYKNHLLKIYSQLGNF